MSSSIIIDAPNLTSLWLKSTDNLSIRFINPLSITALKIDWHCDFDVSVFKNLDFIFIDRFNPGFWLNSIKILDDIKKLENLKELEINDIIGFKNYNLAINKLKDIFSLKKNDLKIIYKGVKIKETTKLDDWYYGSDDRGVFQLKNYDDLKDHLDFVDSFYYNTLLDILPNQPSDLFTKYRSITRLIIDSIIEDENRLIDFIQEYSKFTSLEIQIASLSQQFYNRLSTISSLVRLSIRNVDAINFQFIMKMPNLKSLEVDQNIELNETNLNLNNLKNFDRLTFFIDTAEEPFEVTKHDTDKYKVYAYNDKDEKYSYKCNFSELVNYINNLWNVNSN